MSAKREKRVRMIARQAHEISLNSWYRSKPSKWRIFRYLKWKRSMPVYDNTEKRIRKIIKTRGQG